MKEPFVLKNDLLWLESWMVKNPKLLAGFTTNRNGAKAGPIKGLNIAYHVGDDPSTVQNNRHFVANKMGIPLNQWVFAQQLHTTHIHKVTAKDLGAGTSDFDSGIPATDGLYTTDSNVVLATFYADCTPLYFYAPHHHLIGVAHAGWKGTVGGIMHSMLQTLKNKEGINPDEILVAIGPAIGRDAYRVDDKVITEVLKSPVANPSTTFVNLGGGQYKFDAKNLNYLQALHEGVPEKNIICSAYCTYSDFDLFFSHRRESKAGRMMSFMCLND